MLIGLEVHAYLDTRSKMFCTCPNAFWGDAEPNTLLCPVCTAQPGAKPMAPNARALELGLRLAAALGCEPAGDRARFLRKHYFYPDLPNNYQRTSEPFARLGSVAGVPLREVHWEEDPGAYDPKAGLVDYNRSGAPLLEVVTEPAVRSPAHAREVVEELRLALSYVGALSPAGLKADANLSTAGGARVEVKNLNSSRNVELALEHEAQRQAEVLARGGRVARETRHFDETFLRTEPLRAKETEEDYRHLPDPDLPPLDLAALRARAAPGQPEPPFALREAWTRGLGVTREAANVLLGEPGLAGAFLALRGAMPERAAFEFLVGDLKRELNFRGLAFRASGLGPQDLQPLLEAMARGNLTRARAVALLRARLDEGPGALARGLAAEAGAAPGRDAVQAAARAALEAHPKAVADYRGGRPEALNRLVGEALKRLQGRAPPQEVREAVLQVLEGRT